jgi:2'-5' RNA ligase
MTENKRRVFWAINLPKNLKNELAGLLDKLSSQYGRGVKWVDADILHLTLHFLGYNNEERVRKIKDIAQKISNQFKRMEFEIENISAFPNLNNPRVVFLKSRQVNGDSVYRLQKELGRGLSAIGLEIDQRPWKAHITLGRVKGRVSGLRGLFSKSIDLTHKKFIVHSFELMESKLKPDGPEYRVIESYNL